MNEAARSGESLRFHDGMVGAMAPFVAFLVGVAWLGLSGTPDEKGFWPILVGGLAVGTLLARDRTRYAEAVVHGMSRPIVMLMVTAWLLAGIMGTIMTASGFVDSLVAVAKGFGVSGAGFVATSFVIGAVVSTATGTSLGTLLICAPLLYPAGVGLSADPVWLIGAILGGATFGDNVSPVSDTTIASATTQGADLGGVVRSRMRFALPAAAFALLGAMVFGATEGGDVVRSVPDHVDLGALPMLIVPVVVIGALLGRRHLIEGLLYGIIIGILLAVLTGRIAPGELMVLDRDAFIARGIILSGMERGVGVSVFTILLMGLVGGIEATGLVDRAVGVARRRMRSKRSAEIGIFGAVSVAVLLTTHSTVAILTVGRLAKEAGAGFGVAPYRRANILDVTVCTYPFLLPFFVPTILAASMTVSQTALDVPVVSAFHAGAANLYSWGLLAVLLFSVATGWGDRHAK